MSNQAAVEMLVSDMRRTAVEAPVHKPDPRVAGFALSYLDAFGWFAAELAAWKDISLADIKNALGDFQASLGLKKTNTLTIQTVRAMEAKRCGCPDVGRPHLTDYKEFDRRRQTLRPRWQKDGIRYHVVATPTGVGTTDYLTAVAAGFSVWAVHAPITSAATDDPAAADVLFDVGHGPQSNFDGPGGMVAWTALPEEGVGALRVVLDDDETWTCDQQGQGVCLHAVLRHQIGHVLGLVHATAPVALMAAIYNPTVLLPQPDDVRQIQALYSGG